MPRPIGVCVSAAVVMAGVCVAAAVIDVFGSRYYAHTRARDIKCGVTYDSVTVVMSLTGERGGMAILLYDVLDGVTHNSS